MLKKCVGTGGPTCAEVDDEVGEKEGIRDAVEDDPVIAEVVVEEGDGDRQNDEVRHQKNQHEHVPVEPRFTQQSNVNSIQFYTNLMVLDYLDKKTIAY